MTVRRTVVGLALLTFAAAVASAAPPEPDAAETIRREIVQLATTTDREQALRTVLCLRRHGRALAPALLGLVPRPELGAEGVVRLTNGLPELGLEVPEAVRVLEAVVARPDVPDVVVLAPLADVGPGDSPLLAAVIHAALHVEPDPPAAGGPRDPADLERERRYVALAQTGALGALRRWYLRVPGIRPRLTALALDGFRTADVRFGAASILARLPLPDDEARGIERSAAAGSPLLDRLVVATAVAERLPATASARYATFREAFHALPAARAGADGPLGALARHDLAQALRMAGGDLLPHLLADLAAGAAANDADLPWLAAAARHLGLGWAESADAVAKTLPAATPAEVTQGLLDTERLVLVLLARLGARARDVEPLLVTRWKGWRRHPLGAGPCARTEIALAAIRGGWREPLEESAMMLEGRGGASALLFTAAAAQVEDLPLDAALAPSLDAGLARGGAHRDHVLGYLAGGVRRVTPEARVMLARSVTTHALSARDPAVRREALLALRHLGVSLPAEGCAAPR